jgi:hypothetical protein
VSLQPADTDPQLPACRVSAGILDSELPPYALLSTPVYSLSSANAEGKRTLNIITYASPIALRPQRKYALGLYVQSMSYQNVKETGRAVLQVSSIACAGLAHPFWLYSFNTILACLCYPATFTSRAPYTVDAAASKKEFPNLLHLYRLCHSFSSGLAVVFASCNTNNSAAARAADAAAQQKECASLLHPNWLCHSYPHAWLLTLLSCGGGTSAAARAVDAAARHNKCAKLLHLYVSVSFTHQAWLSALFL